MVCNFVAEYVNGSGPAASSISFPFNIDPPEEISGKECVIKLVNMETSPVVVDTPTTAAPTGFATTATVAGVAAIPLNAISITATTPAVFSINTPHGMVVGAQVVLTSAGGAGPSLTPGTYYVINAPGLTNLQWQMSTTLNGTGVGAATAAVGNGGGTGWNPATVTFTTPTAHKLVPGNSIVINTLPGVTSSSLAVGSTYVVGGSMTATTFQLQTNGSFVPVWQSGTATYTPSFNQLSTSTGANPYSRIPLRVDIVGLTQSKTRLGATLVSGSNVQTTEAYGTTFIGFGAINDSGRIINPSIHCYIPQGPQTWNITIDQLGFGSSYLGGAQFVAILDFQITPISKS